MEWEKLSKALKVQNWVILLILGLASFFLMSQTFTLGVILGGVTVIANFSFLQRTIRRAFSPEGLMRTNKISLLGKSYLRLLLLGIIIYTLINQGLVDPIGLTVGLSIVVISITNVAVRTLWKTSSKEAI